MSYEEINALPYWVVAGTEDAWLHEESSPEVGEYWIEDATAPCWGNPPPTEEELELWGDENGEEYFYGWEAPPSCNWPRGHWEEF